MRPSAASLMDTARRLAHDYLTGEDGETFAIGRGMALGMFTLALLLPVGIAVWAALTIRPSLPDWAAFLGGVGAFWAASGAAVMALVAGTRSTEPKAPPGP